MLARLVTPKQDAAATAHAERFSAAEPTILLVAAAAILMSQTMRKYQRHSAFTLPMMMTRLTMASWETIIRRSLMMAQGTCTPAEYQRMAAEKVAAMQTSMMALARGRSHAAMLAPFVSRTRANVKRLRRKG